MNSLNTQPIIFYDGICGLCDRSVQFIIKYDKKKVFRYAALQSNFAAHTLGFALTFDSFIYYENGEKFYQSTAALKTLKKLGGLWSAAYLFIIIPSFIRDGIYRWVATNRYKWFGKFDTCKIPTAAQRTLFID